jgi:hypothetical protein
VIVIFVFLMKCTGNPFWNDDIDSEDRLTVTGKVQLQDDPDPETIFIWLEGIQVSTYTNSKGEFTLELPAPQLQPGGGLTGSLKLYHYKGLFGIRSGGSG